jgi:hypothetical protein
VVGEIDERRLEALEQMGRSALLKLTDEELEAVVWVVILTARQVENNRRRQRSMARRSVPAKSAGKTRRAFRRS